ncbi:nuclear transport factor 2 family protein [Sphingopyxis sp. XHP0097]|jgi:ketosteroid isomerase-like protein|uniref:Nuclear transport factor 2 family protein n=1 Tax=Sphingopyxis jiangsuensis TaxID=2871171 RepID=A0ABS7MHM8_9SPHN|nr:MULTISPECIES: nuclear transport factor 2 family protein [Sphingopyxis]MBL0768594.1 nuclear transport factor 2 family protein [Sphingopyxis lutea]MBY4638297.1 nuclear transport factor 2 family protein [Sphingopyxis jiangsuensis]
MAEEEQIRAMATRFFDAIEAGDIDAMRSCFTPDAEIWHNTDEAIVTRDQTATTLTGMVARIKDRKYAERRLTVYPGGFVQQHELKGVRVHDDVPVRLPCAIICRVEAGKITRLDEYFDSAHVAEFRKFANA